MEMLMKLLEALWVMLTGVKTLQTLPRYGQTNVDVGILQLALRDKGFSPGTIDNNFGSKTKEALSAFQKSVGLTGTGILPEDGGQTFKKLGLALAKPSQVPTEPTKMTINERVLRMAASQIGVKEIKGSGSNPVVEEYLAWGFSESNKSTSLKDDTAWCAGFVGWVLEKCGYKSTNSLMARSYEKWGKTSKSAALPGDVVTFWRNTLASGSGHVGIFIEETSSTVLVLGGNQNDEVNVTSYAKTRMTDIRRVLEAPSYTQAEKEVLYALARQIKAGNKVQPPGSVV